MIPVNTTSQNTCSDFDKHRLAQILTEFYPNAPIPEFIDQLDKRKALYLQKIIREYGQIFESHLFNIPFLTRCKKRRVKFLIDLDCTIGFGESKIVKKYYDCQKAKIFALAQSPLTHEVKIAHEFKALEKLKKNAYFVHVKFLAILPDMIAIGMNLYHGNLSDFVCTERRLQMNLKGALAVMKRLARGFTYLHESGYVHRDIKITNIFYRMAGFNNVYPVIGDVEYMCKRIWKPKYRYCGTPLCLSPELCWFILTKDPPPHLDQAPFDVWSLGILFFELWKKKEPEFIANHPDSIDFIAWYKVLLELKAVDGLNPLNPVERIIARMLEVDYKKRITMPELSKLLEKIEF